MCQNKARFGSKVKEITFGTLDATPAVAVAVAVAVVAAAAAAVLNPLIDPPTLQARVLGWWWWWWLWSQNGVVKIRKHMVAKSHCKVHYGDGDDDEEVELEEFYDYSSSYMNEDGKQLVASGDTNAVELVGAELVIKRQSNDGTLTKTIGSREFLRYYRQKPRPTPVNNMAITAALASRYRSMGLATVQSREQMVRMKVIKAMNRSGVEAMRTKIGMKSNVIRNLPKNVPY